MTEELYSDYLYSDPLDRPVPLTGIGDNLLLDDLLEAIKPRKITNKPKKKAPKMNLSKKAFDLGSARATKEFMKQAGIIDAAIGSQSKDPRKTLALSLLGTMAAADLAYGGLSGIGLTGHLLKKGLGDVGAHVAGIGGGLGALLGSAYMGSTAPGLLSPTTIEQRLASEVAAKLQNPETMGSAAKNLGGVGLAALAVPYALYQLGKKVGENESSLI